MLQEKKPDVACMNETHRKNGDRLVVHLFEMGKEGNPARITPAPAAWCVDVQFCRVFSEFFVRFEEKVSCVNTRRRHSISRSLCIRALVVTLWSVRTALLLICAELTTPCGIVFAIDAQRQHDRIYKKQ